MKMQDLARLHASIAGELLSAYDDVVSNSSFVGAATCISFEAAFAGAHEAAFAVSCNSGTDALVLALAALGIGPGDEVIVPALTFIATASAVIHVGATPIIADVDPYSLMLSSATVEAAATERTKAVIPVHLYGNPVPFDLIRSWKKRNWKVIEDAAQAHVATWNDEYVGTYGDAACFSFYPGKNLGALGDGGIVITGSEETAHAMQRLRDHGRVTRYESAETGWCSRLDGLQAAFLSAKLGHLAAWTKSRRRLAGTYATLLASCTGIDMVPFGPGSVHHQMVVRVADGRREPLRSTLGEIGIETEVHYPVALSQQKSLRAHTRPCPAAEAAASQVLSLPLDPLMTAKDVATVCDALRECLSRLVG